MSRSVPTAGAPTQKEAVRRCMARNMTAPRDIAAETGIPVKRVYVIMSGIRAAKGLSIVSRSTLERRVRAWPQEKLQRAQRLVGKTLMYIADALQVDREDMVGALGPLLRESGRFGTILEEMAGEVETAPPAVDPDEDERARDEEELARLQQEEDDADVLHEPEPEPEANPVGEEVPPPGAAAPRAARALPAADGGGDVERFKLANEAGDFLHQHTRGMTRISKFIWRGTAAELKALLKAKPHLRDLVPVPC